MSWIDKIENINLEIVTGDGKSFSPLWKDAQHSIEFNTSAFDFIDVEGTYVERKKAKSGKFPVILYFQGEEHLDEAELFLESAKDSRAWTLKHPFYGNLSVQPLALNFDNSGLNLTVVTGTLWETISLVSPILLENAGDKMQKYNDDVEDGSEKVFDDRIDAGLTTTSIAIENVLAINNQLSGVAKLQADIKKYKDLVRSAESGASNILSNVEGAITSAIALINFPFEVIDDVTFRVNAMLNAFDNLLLIFANNNTQEKSVFLESNGAKVLSTLCLVATGTEENPSVYGFRSQVTDTIDAVSARFLAYREFFDRFDYLQDAELGFRLDLMITNTLGSLLEIAFSAKQERSIILNYPDNIINLAFKYFGSGDDNIDEFISINKITADEYLQVYAGRKITYFV